MRAFSLWTMNSTSFRSTALALKRWTPNPWKSGSAVIVLHCQCQEHSAVTTRHRIWTSSAPTQITSIRSSEILDSQALPSCLCPLSRTPIPIPYSDSLFRQPSRDHHYLRLAHLCALLVAATARIGPRRRARSAVSARHLRLYVFASGHPARYMKRR